MCSFSCWATLSGIMLTFEPVSMNADNSKRPMRAGMRTGCCPSKGVTNETPCEKLVVPPFCAFGSATGIGCSAVGVGLRCGHSECQWNSVSPLSRQILHAYGGFLSLFLMNGFLVFGFLALFWLCCAPK